MLKQIEDIHNINSYSYDYPEELVAHKPKEKREQANLLVKNIDDTYEQHKFYELSSLPKGVYLFLITVKFLTVGFIKVKWS